MITKIEETLRGFVEYEEKTYPFLYKEELLNLMPGNKADWKESYRKLLIDLDEFGKNSGKHGWIGYDYLKGVSSDGNEVIFLVSKLASNNCGFISFEVISLFLYSADKISDSSICGICLSGKEINYFYNPGQSFNTEIGFLNNKSTITTEGVKEGKCGEYTYNGVNIKISIRAVPSISFNSSTPYSAKSEMVFVFSESVGIDFVYEIISHCRKFFFYICKRTNISFNDVRTFSIQDEKREMAGTIRINKKEEEELSEKSDRRIIEYSYLKEKVAYIFEAIGKEEMYFEHIQKSINATKSYGINRIILNFVAFEREFRNIYLDEFPRSPEYNEIKSKILESLEEIKKSYTGKRKKYVQEFISSIRKSENKFSDKMMKALLDCEDILKPFLYYDYKKESNECIKDIANRMNKLRNDSAHGNFDLEIKPINISDFRTIQNLLYAMRLKKMQIPIISIKKIICAINSYNIYIED